MSVSANQIKMRVVADADFCPKCGKDAEWQGPRYFRMPFPHSRTGPNEWLRFACSVCGYVRTEPVKDAPKTEAKPLRSRDQDRLFFSNIRRAWRALLGRRGAK